MAELTAFVCRLSRHLGALTCWKLQGLYRECFTFCTNIPNNQHLKNNPLFEQFTGPNTLKIEVVCLSEKKETIGETKT